jgi:N-acetylglucosamine malate deacetylase 2
MKTQLPPARSVLAVCAHPDDESFGLGAILARYHQDGALVSVLCFTHGEASTLHGDDRDLAVVRRAELEAAARVLGIDRTDLLAYPDGGLASAPLDELTAHVARVRAVVDADLLLVFDEGGITGHPDHCRATEAALLAAQAETLPVLAWAMPRAVSEALNAEFGTTFVGRDGHDLDIAIPVDRSAQVQAIRCHASQAGTNPVLWRRLELLGSGEWLRYLTAANDPTRA